NVAIPLRTRFLTPRTVPFDERIVDVAEPQRKSLPRMSRNNESGRKEPKILFLFIGDVDDCRINSLECKESQLRDDASLSSLSPTMT
uniref:Uncharacterized protein n=1 Tax=Glossina palpalis gambiensis TaxID=67801 RepID=A0A1B0B2D0_9MUSC